MISYNLNAGVSAKLLMALPMRGGQLPVMTAQMM